MLNGLQEEIVRANLIGQSNRIVMQKLNEDGSSLTDVYEPIDTNEQQIKLSKARLLTYLTPEQRAGIRSLLSVDLYAEPVDAEMLQKQDFKMLYEADDVFWVNDLTFRGTLDMLSITLNIPESVINEIKRLGERKISRSEELFGRKINLSDFENN